MILNLAPNPFIALEVAFWLLGSLEDRSTDHLMIAMPFFLVSWIILALGAKAYRALALGEEAAVSLGVNVPLTRLLVVFGTAIGVGAAVAVSGAPNKAIAAFAKLIPDDWAMALISGQTRKFRKL